MSQTSYTHHLPNIPINYKPNTTSSSPRMVGMGVPYSQRAPEHSTYFERDGSAGRARSAVELPRRYQNPPRVYRRPPFGSNDMAARSDKGILLQNGSHIPIIYRENALTESAKGRTSQSTVTNWKKDYAVSREETPTGRSNDPPSPLQRRNMFQRREFRITGPDTDAQREVSQRSIDAQNSPVIRRKPVPLSSGASEGSSPNCKPKRALGQSFCRKNDLLSSAAATVLECWPVIRENVAAQDRSPVEWRKTPERCDARFVHQTAAHPAGMKAAHCYSITSDLRVPVIEDD